MCAKKRKHVQSTPFFRQRRKLAAGGGERGRKLKKARETLGTCTNDSANTRRTGSKFLEVRAVCFDASLGTVEYLRKIVSEHFDQFWSTFCRLRWSTFAKRVNLERCICHRFLPGRAALLRLACLFAGGLFFARMTLRRSASRGFQTGFRKGKSA